MYLSNHSHANRGQIIEHNAIQQHVRLHNLPHEIMVEITENLSWPDNVSLSLTCKGLANKTQVARKHFDKVEKAEKLTRDAKRATRVARNLRRNANASPRAPRKSYARPVRRNTKSACNANESLKAPTKFVRLDLLRQIHDFFPATRYSLCYRCIKYVPRNFGSVAWGGHDQYKNRVFDSKIAHELGPRCHRCVERQRLEIFATETQMQQLKKQIARI